MSQQNPLPYIILGILVIPALWLVYAGLAGGSRTLYLIAAVVWVILAAFISASVKIADQWERVVVLSLGKFTELKGPGGILHHSGHREGRLLD